MTDIEALRARMREAARGADFLEVPVDDFLALDAEITRLREELDRVTRERDGWRQKLEAAWERLDATFLHTYRMVKAEAALAKRDEEVARLKAELATARGEHRLRYRHKKRGTTYRLWGVAKLQTDVALNDMDEVVIYACDETDMLWVRRAVEWNDGRFEMIPPTLTQEPTNAD